MQGGGRKSRAVEAVDCATVKREKKLVRSLNRRGVALSLLVLVLSPDLARAQPQRKAYRVGHLSTAGRTVDAAPPRPLRDGLRDLGYIEGQNVAYEARFAEGKVDRLPGLAAELL